MAHASPKTKVDRSSQSTASTSTYMSAIPAVRPEFMLTQNTSLSDLGRSQIDRLLGIAEPFPNPALLQPPQQAEQGGVVETPEGSKTKLHRSLSFKLDMDTKTIIKLKRAAYTYDEIEDHYFHVGDDKTNDGKDTEWHCPRLDRVFPCLGYAKTYDYRNDLLLDVIGGVSVACLHLPQCLAYGLLANLTPASGVYTSLFSVLIYVVFGTVPHMSMGTNAVLSLITGAMVEREADRILGKPLDYVHTTASFEEPGQTSTVVIEPSLGHDSTERMNIKLGVAMTSTFECGLILLAMGLLRMGFLTNYMPSSFVGGFTSAAALHIAVSQMQHIINVKVPLRTGFGKLIRTVIDVIGSFSEANIPDMVVCAVSLVALMLMDRGLNPIVKVKLDMSLPSNLMLVILSCVVSYLVDLKGSWGISVVGPISANIPTPRLPMVDSAVITNVLYDSFIQAVIIFTMGISIAMLMEKIHSFELDANQELIAFGMCNLGSAFFTVQSSSVSPPRSMLLSHSGVKTTFHGIPTVVLLLCSTSFLTGLFQPLPLATLSAMILVAMMDMLKQITKIPRIWRVSRTDFLVWVSTWLSTAFGDLEYGVATGILTAALCFMVNNQFIKGDLVVRSVNEDMLIPGLGRALTKHLDKTRVFYFPSQLFFANAESFKKQLYEQVFDPRVIENRKSDASSLGTNDIEYLILDCSAMTYIDIDGLNMLKTVVIRYHNVGVQVMLARCPHTIMDTLERGDLFSILPRSLVFHEVLDALARETEVMMSGGYISPSLRQVSIARLVPSYSTSIF